MIVWDTEATGGLKPSTVPMDQQPEMMEFGAVKLDDETLEEKDHIHFLIKPKILWPIPAQVTEWNNITTEMLQDAPSFAGVLRAITTFVLGERRWLAHNISYDLGVMYWELARVNMLMRFPWPPEPICTVELTMDLEVPRQKSDRLKQEDLYARVIGEKPPVTHRALDDARSLATILRWLRTKDNRI